MKTRRLALMALFGSTSWAAQAADKVLYQPVPAWVKPAPAIDPAKVDGESPILLVLDDQERLSEGQVWAYKDTVTRLASPDVVKQAGMLSLSWQPAKGDLIVHGVEILRGGERINALAGGRSFTILRREQQLEQAAIDGTLTATLAVEGLRVGDLLRVVASTTDREPALKGAMQTVAAMPAAPMRVGFARIRMLWPQPTAIQSKVYADGAKTTTTVVGNFRELTVTGPLPKPPEMPADAPQRFSQLPLVEASSFADWNAVSQTMAPLFATDGTIAADTELARAVATIAAADADPLRRTAAALQLVQDKVRYLYNGLDSGNYVPQSPAQTWTLRYGDCKAKTLLLLTILRQLGIEAEPVLASSTMSDYLPTRLPSAQAFDHVLVHATIAGRPYWLDGTGSGARYADLGDTPAWRWVLPLRVAGAGLLAVPQRAPATPVMIATLDLDQRAGLKLPTLVHARLKVRGAFAEAIGLAKTQGSKEQKDQLVGGAMMSLTGRETAIAGYTIAYDSGTAEAVIDADGMMTTPWQLVDKRYRADLDKTVSSITFDPDRARAAWRSIPVTTGEPTTLVATTHVMLPPDITGFALEGDTTLDKRLAGSHVVRTSTIANGVITINDRISNDGIEVAPAEISAMRADVALAKTRLLRVVAPSTPPRWQMIAAAKRDGRLKSLEAAYAKPIAADPDDAEGYVNRANFNEGVYDWAAALPDRDKAVTLDPSLTNLLSRAYVHRVLGHSAKAAADYEAALAIDPASPVALAALGELDIEQGRRDAAIERVDRQIAAGGERRSGILSIKADLLARIGDKTGALAAMDAAVTAKPGNPQLLNGRCWLKAQLNVALDTALKDCTRAIELGDSSIQALDSRALVYVRLDRLDEAMADLDAVLDAVQELAPSLYLRGIIRMKRGEAGGKDDMAAARMMAPLIDGNYRPFGIGI